MLGAWQTAVLKTLEMEHGLRFDTVLGFSSGALAATGYFLDLTEKAFQRWLNAEQLRLLRFKPRLFPLTIFSGRPLWDATTEAHDEDEARKRARCRLVIASHSRLHKNPIYAVYEPGRGRWDSPLSGHLMASCAIPWVFPPVKVPYQGRRLTLVDGGTPGREPLSFAELSHCDDILVIETISRDMVELPRTMGGLHGRLIARMEAKTRRGIRAVMDRAIRSFQAAGKVPRIFRLNPSRPLNFSLLSFKRAHMGATISLGHADARAFMAAPEKFRVA